MPQKTTNCASKEKSSMCIIYATCKAFGPDVCWKYLMKIQCPQKTTNSRTKIATSGWGAKAALSPKTQ
jgi:hypothetical protein